MLDILILIFCVRKLRSTNLPDVTGTKRQKRSGMQSKFV